MISGLAMRPVAGLGRLRDFGANLQATLLAPLDGLKRVAARLTLPLKIGGSDERELAALPLGFYRLSAGKRHVVARVTWSVTDLTDDWIEGLDVAKQKLCEAAEYQGEGPPSRESNNTCRLTIDAMIELEELKAKLRAFARRYVEGTNSLARF